jgi:energy-coupling factor transporter transmembrane protein EcfT
LTALFTVLVFIINELIVAAVQMALFMGLCCAARIPLKKIFPHARLLAGVIALVIALQVFFGQGLYTGLMIGCRVVALTALMPLLIMTTDAQILALGITRLGLNYRAAYIITSTLNLIPSFEEEARQIIDARKLRGMKSVKLGEYPAIALPLMVRALRQGQLMALAMDARAFGAYRTRTWLRDIKLSAADYAAWAAGAAWAAVAVTANCLLGG